MKARILLVACLFSAAAAAAGLGDFAKQWPVAAKAEGAYAVTLAPEIYTQLTRRDLSDLVAFNGDGEALPFGPMPASYAPAPGAWREAAWFALPAELPPEAGDLSLHVSRAASGELSLDATLSHGSLQAVPALLVDVRAKKSDIEAIAFDLALDAPDFSAEVSVEASDDLQAWRTLVPVATVAQLRQNGQVLLRRNIDLPPQRATYLRIRALGTGQQIPVRGVRLRLRNDGDEHANPPRHWLAAEFVRSEGRAFIYRLVAPIPAEQVNVDLGKDNGLANFSISARETNEKNWSYVGQLTAFRLRGAGLAMDNDAMDIGVSRLPEWRIESSVDLAKPPVLRFGYRPETWLLLTEGKPPYVVAAGSAWARREDYPLPALVAQARGKYGQDWHPALTTLGPAGVAGGEAALKAYNRDQIKSLLLWAVLVLGAGGVLAMVLRLMKSPPKSDPPPP